MTTSDSNSLPRLGEALVAAGLVTAEQVEMAVAKQQETGEKLGTLLVQLGFTTRDAVDTCLRQNVIAPTLLHELEILAEGAFQKLPSPTLSFKQLYRRRLITDNLMAGEHDLNETVVVELQGAATIKTAGKESLPFAFRIDADNSMVSIDELDAGGLRLWITKTAGRIASGEAMDDSDEAPDAPLIGMDDLTAALSELLSE